MRQLESGCIPGRCVFFVLVLLIAFCICPPEPTLQLFSKKKYNEKSKFKNDEYMFTCTTTGSVTSRPVFQKEMFSYLCLIHHHHSCWPNYLSQFLLHYRVPENTNRKIIFVHQIVWIPYNIAHCTKHSRKNQLDPTYSFKIIPEWHISQIMLLLDAEFDGADGGGYTGGQGTYKTPSKHQRSYTAPFNITRDQGFIN